MCLRLKGYQILAERYKTKAGEIDLVALKKTDLVFVEVKQRQTIKEAQEALTYTNRKRVTQAAEIFVSRSPKLQNKAIRFDAICASSNWKIRHIKDAWRDY